MSCGCDDSILDTCGCCEDGIEEQAHPNPPGRSALEYRIDTFPGFLARMRARIHGWRIPDGPATGTRPLAALTTRAPDDPAIALMDAGAVMLDVLTFYQERIANEGYLRTATERHSVLELARAIGYELAPGVAAETYVAFSVTEADGTPAEARVPAGTQILSVPAGRDERPQTFETDADLTARRAWNALRPRLTQPHPLGPGLTHIFLEGTATGLAAGDPLLLVVGDTATPKRVRRLAADPEARRTRVDFAAELAEFEVAPPGNPEGELDPEQEALALTRENVDAFVFRQAWTEPDLQAFLGQHGWDVDEVMSYVEDLRAESFESHTEQVVALRERVGFFGHNAPLQEMLPSTESTRGNPYPNPWDGTGYTRTIWQDSQGTDYSEADVYLERPVSGIAEGSWVLFSVRDSIGVLEQAYRVERAFEASLADFGISGKATGLELEGGTEHSRFLVRRTAAHVRGEELALAPLPLEAPLAAGEAELWLDTMAPGLAPGQAVLLTGEEPDAGGRERSEILVLEEVLHSGGYTRLTFESGPAYSYERGSVAINANVALASHGETVAGEVLGSGDGSVAHQRFALKKPPLTYRSAAPPSVLESTLTLRVDGVAWEEVSSLYGQDADARVFVVRLDDDANARVVFGDGVHGARLPTGRENVTATYRSGIGVEGEVGAGSLTLLKSRPFGVQSVSNPHVASGAEDPETLDDARQNAPLTVLTLDRVVSLQDYEDFARAYPGIGKARVAAVWDGEAQVVHLTVADASGDPVVPPLSDRLLDAIESARDPLARVRLDSYRALVFYVEAKLLVDEAHVWETVAAEVEAALKEAFAFERRAFAQPVTAAEVLETMHDVEGVVAVDLDALYATAPAEAPPSGGLFNAVLGARPARYDDASGAILPAELLTVHGLGITLTPMSS